MNPDSKTSKDAFAHITNPDGTPVRDKDNAQPVLKPNYSNRAAPNIAPTGGMGIRQSRSNHPLVPRNDNQSDTMADHMPDKQQDRDTSTERRERIQFRKPDNPLVPRSDEAGMVIDEGHPTNDQWQAGRILIMPGYSFSAIVDDKPSGHGIGGGSITHLELQKDGGTVARFDRGWDRPPQTAEQREAIQRIRNGLDDPPKGRTTGFDHRKCGYHGLER